MLLSQSLPTQFLLPSFSVRQLSIVRRTTRRNETSQTQAKPPTHLTSAWISWYRKRRARQWEQPSVEEEPGPARRALVPNLVRKPIFRDVPIERSEQESFQKRLHILPSERTRQPFEKSGKDGPSDDSEHGFETVRDSGSCGGLQDLVSQRRPHRRHELSEQNSTEESLLQGTPFPRKPIESKKAALEERCDLEDATESKDLKRSDFLEEPTDRKYMSEKPKSLFKQLFPNEDDFDMDEELSLQAAFEKLPPFRWLDSTEEKADKAVKMPIEVSSKTEARLLKSTVLVLHRVSKTLEESDFFRLSHRGKHIEGWTSGINKVIQVRDVLTLDPMGTYLLQFSTPKSCNAYLQEVNRLHQLSKLQAKAAVSGSLLPPPARLVNPGEDIEVSLRGFTVLPSHDSNTLVKLAEPYDSQIERLLNDSGPPILAPFQDKFGSIVLFMAEQGVIDTSDLREAVRLDGRRRNLKWKLTSEGKDIVKLSGSELDEEGNDPDSEDGDDRERRPPRRRPNYPTPPKYLLIFEDRNEARRFAREWHRRPFPTNETLKPGDDPPPIIHTEIIW